MKLYKYTTAQYALEYLRTNEIKVTTLFDTNDPNEWIPFLQSQEDGSNYLSQYSHKADFKKRYGENYGFKRGSNRERIYGEVLANGR